VTFKDFLIAGQAPLFYSYEICNQTDCFQCDANKTQTEACKGTGGISCCGDWCGTNEEATICGANEYVSSNVCTACAAGSTKDAGSPASGPDTACDGPSESVGGVYKLGGVTQAFFETNTGSITAALRSTIATTATVPLASVTMSNVKYMLSNNVRRLNNGAGTISASYSIIVTSESQAKQIFSAIIATRDAPSAFVSLFVTAVAAETGTTLSVTVKEVDTQSSYDNNSSANDDSDDNNTVLIAVLCTVAGIVIILAIVGFMVSRNNKKSDDGKQQSSTKTMKMNSLNGL